MDDRTDEEVVEMIREWLAQYGLTLAAAILIALGAIFGWNYYQESKRAAAEKLSDDLIALQDELVNDKLSEAETRYQEMKKQDKSMRYAALAAMTLAKVYAEKGDAKAAEYLSDARLSTDDMLRDVATLRLARWQMTQNRVDDAAALLNTIKNESLNNSLYELQGDIARAKGDFTTAREHYSKVTLPTQLLRLKMANLPAVEEVALVLEDAATEKAPASETSSTAQSAVTENSAENNAENSTAVVSEAPKPEAVPAPAPDEAQLAKPTNVEQTEAASGASQDAAPKVSVDIKHGGDPSVAP